ncbi:MAG: rod shape determining protein RodA [Verrucomicrobiales bacterium]
MTALRAGRAGFNDRDTNGPLWIRVDVSIVLLATGLLCIGLVVVYSATRGVLNPEIDVANRGFVEKQLIFVGVGSFLAAVVSAIDYRKTKLVIPVIYAGTLALLLGLFVFGENFNGATSWYSFGFITLQPSEFAKLTLILALASWFSSVQSREGLQFFNVMLGLVMAGVFAVLVLLQPDFGTVMVYAAIVAGIVVVAGVAMRHVAVVLGIVAFAITAMIQRGFLRETQLNRFWAFVDPENIARYNVNQSEIAIGNGGLRGKGLFQGTQNNNSLVPEKETDFIFSVLGEEFGFLGGAVLLTLFGLLLLRIWRVAHLAEDEYGRLICVGVFSMFLFQAFQSIGMNMGMMPVTGIPLPLISYGGSSMLTSLIALGLVENVHAHRLR